MYESSPLEREVIAYFVTRFGVPPDCLSTLRFREHNGEIWASSEDPPEEIRSRRPPGLRIARRPPDGLKPTSAFLMLLSHLITRSRCDLPIDELRRVLLGGEIDLEASDGYVALTYRGDVLGCGRARSGRVRAVIPTGRRRELLDALAHDNKVDPTIL